MNPKLLQKSILQKCLCRGYCAFSASHIHNSDVFMQLTTIPSACYNISAYKFHPRFHLYDSTVSFKLLRETPNGKAVVVVGVSPCPYHMCCHIHSNNISCCLPLVKHSLTRGLTTHRPHIFSVVLLHTSSS